MEPRPNVALMASWLTALSIVRICKRRSSTFFVAGNLQRLLDYNRRIAFRKGQKDFFPYFFQILENFYDKELFLRKLLEFTPIS
jgi:hypothetical protein